MAMPVGNEESWDQRRNAMVNYRKYGWSYVWIANKFGIKPPTARQIILRACKNVDPRKQRCA
jgi:hypothetical protein